MASKVRWWLALASGGPLPRTLEATDVQALSALREGWMGGRVRTLFAPRRLRAADYRPTTDPDPIVMRKNTSAGDPHLLRMLEAVKASEAGPAPSAAIILAGCERENWTRPAMDSLRLGGGITVLVLNGAVKRATTGSDGAVLWLIQGYLSCAGVNFHKSHDDVLYAFDFPEAIGEALVGLTKAIAPELEIDPLFALARLPRVVYGLERDPRPSGSPRFVWREHHPSHVRALAISELKTRLDRQIARGGEG